MSTSPTLASETDNSGLDKNFDPNLGKQRPDALPLAQRLSEQLKITPEQWHQLKANRKARALEQAAAAMVYLLKDQPEEALARFQQAVGWLDRSISAPPCPTHGHGSKS
jgi:Family of unknown function (DUF6439)